MKFRKSIWLIIFTIFAVTLSSCNFGATPAPTQDLGAIQTQAFNLVLTQVAAQSSPTPLPTNTFEPTATLSAPATFAPVGGGEATPFLFSTPLPNLGLTPLASPVPTIGVYSTITTKNGCNDGVLVEESKPYDGDVMAPGAPFDKSFKFLNTGSCTWDEGYTFAFLPGPNCSDLDFKGGDIVIKLPADFVKPGGYKTFTFQFAANNKPGTHRGCWRLRDDTGNYFGSLVWVQYVINQK